MIHHSHASVVLSMEVGTWIMAITLSMWLSGWGPGHSHYRNSSSICHLQNQNDHGGEASLTGSDHSPISGRSGPEESTTWTYCPMCTAYHAASAAGRDLVYVSCCTGNAVLSRSRSTLVKIDILCANISLLPSSVGLAGDMP